MYYNGQGVKQNSSKAKALFGKACDGGNANGCKYYAILNKR
jgi:TPR repeat protein